MLVNNGKYRRSVLAFRKFYGGVESFSGGFPVFEDIKNAFAEFPALTQEEFQTMSDEAYQTRLGFFYNYLGIKHAFFNPTTMIPDINDEAVNSNGTDTDHCPIDYPIGERYYLSLDARYRVEGDDKYARVFVTLKNRIGESMSLPYAVPISWVLKETEGGIAFDWGSIVGVPMSSEILADTSETELVPEFRYYGELPLTSVEVTLLPQEENSLFHIYPVSRVSITAEIPAFLVNHVSNLQHAYQEMISQEIVQEKVNSGEGIHVLGKRDHTFVFEPGQPKRPVFIYPKSWGKLSEIIIVEAFRMNIINDGAFLYDENGEPFEYELTVDGETLTYYVYASHAMIIYPYREEYIYKF